MRSSCRPALGCFPEALHRPPRMTGWRSVSQLAGATGAEVGERLLGELIEPAPLGVSLDPLVEMSGLEFLKPGAELCELVGRQFGYGFLDVLKARHTHQAITSTLARHWFASHGT